MPMRDKPHNQPEQANASDYSAVRVLITQERAQKLDLLIHLLGNLPQTLVLLGPKDVGKTNFLTLFQKNCQDRWWIFNQAGSSTLSFESIIINLNRFLNLTDSRYGFDLSALRNFCAQQQVVLIIDDAGELVPGLISELIDLSDALLGLRLVFAMTHDQFHLKRSTDKAIDDSHVIELPPLTLSECYDFLAHLSLQPGSSLAYKSITDSLVAELYQETHGLPGKIIQEFPKLHRYQKRHSYRNSIVILAVIIASLSTAWLAKDWLIQNNLLDLLTTKSPDSIATVNKTPLAIPKIEQITTAIVQTPPQPTLDEKPALPNEAEAIKPQLSTEKSETSQEVKKTEQIALPTAMPIEVKPAYEEAKPVLSADPSTNATVEPIKKPETELDALNWIAEQPATNYTLQIMVLSNKNAVKIFMKRYADYQDSLKYYTITSNEQERYVLIYGSFTTAEEARETRNTLPKDFQKGLEKRFRIIQNESRH